MALRNAGRVRLDGFAGLAASRFHRGLIEAERGAAEHQRHGAFTAEGLARVRQAIRVGDRITIVGLGVLPEGHAQGLFVSTHLGNLWLATDELGALEAPCILRGSLLAGGSLLAA